MDESSSQSLAGTGPLVRAEAVSLSYGGRAALEDVSLALGPGEILSLIGPNGSGKTSLVRVLLGLAVPDAGRIDRREGLRVGYVPQAVTIDRTLPLTVRRFTGLFMRNGRDELETTLTELGVAHLADSPFQDLSGGERQRVLLARALLGQPELLVLDEPTQGVDVTGQDEIYRHIRAARDRTGCGVLIVSHDLHLVMASTDRVLCLNGHVCCSGTAAVVVQSPEFKALFGSQAVYVHHHDHVHDRAEASAEDTQANGQATGPSHHA
ncbi:MAG: metal ABC transporter ATP-binding protein [Alphaproteobacteria bacterium]